MNNKELSIVYAVKARQLPCGTALYLPRSQAANTPSDPKLWVSHHSAEQAKRRLASKGPFATPAEVVAFKLVPCGLNGEVTSSLSKGDRVFRVSSAKVVAGEPWMYDGDGTPHVTLTDGSVEPVSGLVTAP